MTINEVINKAAKSSVTITFFDIVDDAGDKVVSNKPYSSDAFREAMSRFNRGTFIVTLKKNGIENARQAFPSIPVTIEASPINALAGVGSDISNVHQFAYMQEKSKADKLERENERLQALAEQRRDKIVELEKKLDKQDSDFKIERMNGASERSSGLNGLMEKVSSNPQLLEVATPILTKLLDVFAQPANNQQQLPQGHQGGSEAQQYMMHVNHWFSKLNEQDKISFIQLWQLILNENQKAGTSFAQILHNLKDLFDEDSSQANG